MKARSIYNSVLLIALLTLVFVGPVFAQDGSGDAASAGLTLETAVGLGALASVVVGLVKKLGVIPDGKAGFVAVGLNVVIYGLLAVGGALGWDLVGVDNFAGALAQLATVATPFLLTVAGSLGAHKLARSMFGG